VRVACGYCRNAILKPAEGTAMAKLKLYYSPGACSLAPHLALELAGADYEPVRVDFSKSEQRSPEYLRINPKGRVPVIADGDWVLTENPAILRYIAETHPAKKLWPDNARDEGRCAEWMAFCSSTVHVTYAHTRRPERYASDEKAKADVVAKAKETCRDVWGMVEAKLGKSQWSAGDRLSVADPYLLVFWTWGRGTLAYDMAKEFPNWTALAHRLAALPEVKRVFEHEGLKLPA
jgi:glutathione S-transferase